MIPNGMNNLTRVMHLIPTHTSSFWLLWVFGNQFLILACEQNDITRSARNKWLDLQ